MSVDDASRKIPATPPAAGDDAWERAYLRFQSPAQEVRKFVRRLRQLGTRRWPRDAAVLELFCGRGNGGGLLLAAVEQWRVAGFGHLEYSRTMRWVIPGATLTALGVQTILASFLVSLLGMGRR